MSFEPEIAVPEKNKQFELVWAGANDGYHGDYISRLQFSLEFNLGAIKNAGLEDDFGICLVEWGERGLLESVSLQSGSEKVVRALRLNEKQLTLIGEGVEEINVGVAVNFGIFSSNAKFILVGASDTLLNEQSIRRLVDWSREETNLKRGSFIYIERKFLHPTLFQGEVRPGHIRNLLSVDAYRGSGQLVAAGGRAGLIGGLRHLWRGSGGLNEKLKGYGGNDNEAFFHFSQHTPAVNLTSECGALAYKIPYAASGSRKRIVSAWANRWSEVFVRDGLSKAAELEATIVGISEKSATEDIFRFDIPNQPIDMLLLAKEIVRTGRFGRNFGRLLRIVRYVAQNKPKSLCLSGDLDPQEVICAFIILGSGRLRWFTSSLSQSLIYSSARIDYLAGQRDSINFTGDVSYVYTNNSPPISAGCKECISGNHFCLELKDDGKLYAIRHQNADEELIYKRSCLDDLLQVVINPVELLIKILREVKRSLP